MVALVDAHRRDCSSLSFAGAQHKHLCGQVLQDRPLVSDSSPGLGAKKEVYFRIARAKGITPL